MAKPDPHADELKVELDQVTWNQYVEARDNEKQWGKIADDLQKQIEDQIGDAFAGTINNRKVVTNRPIQTWRLKQLQIDYPELSQHYLKPTYKDEFDAESFGRDHPDILDKYRSRAFKSVADL